MRFAKTSFSPAAGVGVEGGVGVRGVSTSLGGSGAFGAAGAFPSVFSGFGFSTKLSIHFSIAIIWLLIGSGAFSVMNLLPWLMFPPKWAPRLMMPKLRKKRAR